MNDELAPTDYRTRRGQLSAYGRAWNSSRKLLQLQWVVGIVLSVLLVGLLLACSRNGGRLWPLATLATVLIVAGGLWTIRVYTRRHFIEPDLAFRKWLQQVCDGDLHARIDLPETHWHYRELNFHTRNLANALMRLSTDMETLVNSQTKRLGDQNRELALLLKLAADVARETDQRRVLDTVCSHLADWIGDASVIAHGVANEDITVLAKHRSGRTLDGSSGRSDADRSDAWLDDEPVVPVRSIEFDTAGDGQLSQRVRIPYFEGERLAGMITVLAGRHSAIRLADTSEVFTAVSEQMSLFLTKQASHEQLHKTRLQQERNALAADIHDSLAQTLLASRYQVTLLREALEQGKAGNVYEDVVKIESAIDEANQEVRGLIHEYRSELTAHRSADAMKRQIDQFRDQSGIPVFFQLDDAQISFTPREEAVVQRIVGEALNNARKYARPTMIRVFLRYNPNGSRLLLVEDDGVGFDPGSLGVEHLETDQKLDSHLGLSIMNERALGIGGVLSIDSEPGEGTRITLELPPLAVPVHEDTDGVSA